MNNKLFFCTLFDKNYLSRGLAMYESLLAQCPDFHLYIFAFDEPSFQYLTQYYNKENITAISLKQFETPALLSIKKGRSIAEYCWTCTPFVIKHCIENYGIDHCTYLDADLYFYSNPRVLIDEASANSVLITPHFYYPGYDQSALSGIFCVQFLYIRNDERGMKVLNWWADACFKWCYAKFEWGKFGDQKYLDCWSYVFDGVYICENRGAGMAPWNAVSYNLQQQASSFMLTEKSNENKWPLIFYHYHGVKFFSNGYAYLNDYDLSAEILRFLYMPYLQLVTGITKNISNTGLIAFEKKEYAWRMYTMKQKTGTYLADVKSHVHKLIAAMKGKGLRRELHGINYNMVKTPD